MITLPHLSQHAVGIIYAGGHGTRLWPISTSRCPKQVNPVFSKHTLVVDAYERARQIFEADKILLLVTEHIFPKIRELLPLPDNQYIIQPDTEDTEASMGIAAMIMESQFPGCFAVTMYSDHVITQIDAFAKTLETVIQIAKDSNQIIAIGTKPTEPTTQFGYIQIGKILSPNLYTILSFEEKPSKQSAQEYMQSGQYVWNTGVYIWHPNTLLQHIKASDPNTYALLVTLKTHIGSPTFYSSIQDFHTHVVRRPFELFLENKTTLCTVYIADYEWKDIGNWKAIYDSLPKDSYGNAILNPSHLGLITLDSQNNLILPHQKTVTLVGVENLIVVQTENELLICHKDKAAKVKELVNMLKQPAP